ncbi:MAG: LAGLIDADG homing endonuclease [Candidatus Daviesbacteria bacterium GW2011_GWA1_41_61]|nr:MAG: LAGLIDADG homing endonuclease [Candidatus Daviesbacteria bacterium GW2011_GWC1_40_9]KKR92355.1 MAG: LAGLIDADG homing endonuclease [Candidatus Daviesbacteria bacterium GW2011_GWB1_41_15]KKS14543.1 MAG: LAGLIDADG homing endonuclease [Candidatus Daviesbacteria bacterium GW2011_GWA1_41_61]
MIFTARKNLKLDVSDKQVEILIGCLLGDAYLTKLGKIQIEQSDKQEEYIKWKHQELASISYSGLKEVVRFDKQDKRVTKSFRFWTRQFFKSWRDIFYRGGCKVFPKELKELITPLAIAVWYMDDGSYDMKSNYMFSTESFDLQSRIDLLRKLEFWEVEATLKNSGKLRIRSKSLKKFFELVGPYVHQSMKYKLP